MGYVLNTTDFDMENPKDVEELLHNWLPDIEVIESTGQNWADDEFAQGTWPVLRGNQLTKYGRIVREQKDGFYLAGSDYAGGWAGFMGGFFYSSEIYSYIFQ